LFELANDSKVKVNPRGKSCQPINKLANGLMWIIFIVYKNSLSHSWLTTAHVILSASPCIEIFLLYNWMKVLHLSQELWNFDTNFTSTYFRYCNGLNKIHPFDCCTQSINHIGGMAELGNVPVVHHRYRGSNLGIDWKYFLILYVSHLNSNQETITTLNHFDNCDNYYCLKISNKFKIFMCLNFLFNF
jgi:hypothetical protein